MMTDTFVDRLSEYLDGELPAAERASVVAHLAECAACRTTLEELRSVVARAAIVQDAPPDRNLWPGVAARLDASPRPHPSFLKRVFTSRLSFTLPQLAAASLVLMVLSGGLVWMARSGDPRADFQPLNAQTGADAAGSISAADAAEAYDVAVDQLEKALESKRGNLDAETVRVLDLNVAAADRTIAECRRALAADSGNVALQTQIVRAQQRKLSLLRAALAQASRPNQ
jgi:anti-sigma factor RsiW